MVHLARFVIFTLSTPIMVAGFLVRFIIYAWSAGDHGCDEFMDWLTKDMERKK